MKTYQDRDHQVYMHINKFNGKVYIGITSRSVKDRWQNGKGYHGMRFERAIKKYGWDGFEHIVIAKGLSQKEACAMEKDLIAEYDATNREKGYNSALGGEGGGMYGKHHTEEAKRKIKEARIRDGFTEEHKRHISESKQGAKHHHAKPVYQYSRDGKLIKVWEYMSLAAKELGINKANIGEACNGNRKSAGGFCWAYEPR